MLQTRRDVWAVSYSQHPKFLSSRSLRFPPQLNSSVIGFEELGNRDEFPTSTLVAKLMLFGTSILGY